VNHRRPEPLVGTGEIAAHVLTEDHASDAAQVPGLLGQAEGEITSMTADGAYDQDRVSTAVAERHPEVAVVVPPRVTAVPNDTAATAPKQRDRHLQHLAGHGRIAWRKTCGNTMWARAEAAIGRLKQVVGDGLRSRTDDRRTTEVDITVHALNRMVELERPSYVRTAKPQTGSGLPRPLSRSM